MRSHRLTRQQAEYLDSLDQSFCEELGPDDWTFEVTLERQRAVYADLKRERLPEPTSWLQLPEEERARIRPPRRRTAAGLLVLVRGEGQPAGTCGEGEAA